MQTGRTVPTLPSGADRSFDLGVVITFRDRGVCSVTKRSAASRGDASHLQPLVRRYEIYNFDD